MEKVAYAQLNARQKENFNYAKLASVLADYGFICHRLSDDWQGADFIAQHIDGETFLKVQLKPSLAIARKYERKNIHIGFQNKEDGVWYLVPHDEAMPLVILPGKAADSKSWLEDGYYAFSRLSGWMKRVLEPYRLT